MNEEFISFIDEMKDYINEIQDYINELETKLEIKDSIIKFLLKELKKFSPEEDVKQ